MKIIVPDTPDFARTRPTVDRQHVGPRHAVRELAGGAGADRGRERADDLPALRGLAARGSCIRDLVQHVFFPSILAAFSRVSCFE